MAPRRWSKNRPDEVATPNGLVASAARLDLKRKPSVAIQQAWQEEAWRFYDTVGELRYSANWMGNSLGRAVLYPAEIGTDGKPSMQATEDPVALAAAARLLGGPANQAAILSQIGIHLTIAGDCYVIGETPTDAFGNPLPDDEWYVASTDELFYEGNEWRVDRGNGRHTLNPDETVIIRVWQSHPRKRWLADSPTRSVLPVLRELETLVKTQGQQMDSRLAGAGLLMLPSEVTYPQPSPEAMDANPDADPLTLALAENIYTPLDNPEDPSRLTPFVLRMPGEFIKDVQHITLADAITKVNLEARQDCIRRLALGLDMPPEELLGMSSANHWGAWAIEEQSIKLHFAPKLTTIVNAFTVGYYEPALEKLGADPYRFCLWFDTAELSQRPDMAADAKDLYDRGEISGKALRRATGFGEDDAPSQEERIGRLLIKVAPAHPELLGQLLPHLGIDWLGVKSAALPVSEVDTGPGVQGPAAALPPSPAGPPPAATGTPNPSQETS